MNATQLFRASSAAAVIGGSGIVLLDVAQIASEVPRRTVGLAEIPIILAVLFGLPGLYVRQAARAGYLGLVGFALTFAAVALGIGHYYMVAFVEAGIGTSWPEAAEAARDSSRIMMPFEFLAFVLGWLLFGIATLRTGLFPRLAAILLIVGILLVLTRAFLPLPGPVGGVLMGVSIAWLGVELFRSAPRAKADLRGERPVPK